MIDEGHVCRSQWAISTSAMYYSKFDQEVKVFIKVSTGHLPKLKNKGKDQLVIHESGHSQLQEQSPTRAF